jgi:hypothetical protein
LGLFSGIDGLNPITNVAINVDFVLFLTNYKSQSTQLKGVGKTKKCNFIYANPTGEEQRAKAIELFTE